ncbi:DNA polymerase subunit gamma-1 [Aplysia californica]|uniref:DNA-directed DNA polymerase n=1 Tax=Aplysia californica TaxID=6500 RepID=A0ABM1A618_APLCA|nr:DNA polymerase subunit gamma-1 [Aplysia californica]
MMSLSSVGSLKQLTQMSWCQYQWCRNLICQKRWSSSSPRFNSVNIQMLTESLHQQIFKTSSKISKNELGKGDLEKVHSHLKKHGLSSSGFSSTLPEVNLRLPDLHGQNMNEHFEHIARQQAAPYRTLVEELAGASLPPMPREWNRCRGWTKYNKDGTFESVPFPDDHGLVFDIECLVPEGQFPTMATAVSSKHWYSWVSDFVLEDTFRWADSPQLKDLIPLETKDGSIVPPLKEWSSRLIIGHNVGFDRSFVKEQYLVEGTQLRFLDTMSMHIAICGQTSFQRLLHRASGKESSRKEVVEHAQRQKLFKMASSDEWKKISSMNNLRDVHQLHCGGEAIEKSKRDVFMDGTMMDVREQFQDLMTYCANDVKATHEVFASLWPQFKERFPHPVTLAGMLEMGTAYLPVLDTWPRYIQSANNTFDEMERELKKLLMTLADDACRLLQNDEYKNDPWLWDLDWTVSDYRLKKTAGKSLEMEDPFDSVDHDADVYPDYLRVTEGDHVAEEHRKTVRQVYSSASRIPKNPTFMPGYPAWYKDLCPRPNDEDFYPGPSNISSQCRVAPKLMRLTWEGFPVHYHTKHGWGYLVPYHEELTEVEMELREQDTSPEDEHRFPLQAFLSFVKENNPLDYGSLSGADGLMGSPEAMKHLDVDFDQKAMDTDEKILHWETALSKKPRKIPDHVGVGPFNIDIPGVRFYKIPHKNGGHNKVGNPLARDYLLRAKDGTLKASTGAHANRALLLGRMCSYWKNNQKRIMGQMHVWLQKQELGRTLKSHPDYKSDGLYGAIVPRIVTAGTITRRAVEPTWLTASNAYTDRIGSELKSMIQAPPGHCFVGADVDSQELWIAAVLGDAYFMKEHGCTALGWMTLQGNKADKTDLHSKTAEIVSISRDHAKVMNYGRIYGAGQTFAERLLMQFNPQLSSQEAKRKSGKMYKQTKGQRNAQGQWIGGSESYMFNALESVANSEQPLTPVLGCRISKALEPQFVLDDFLTSRVNWVVQSSAVDYLHLMLVCMRWLLSSYNIKGRFCVSIHDEVRYLVTSSDKYRAALALQITNLLTRSMFAHKLGMEDLPQSVAFFSAVDIDSCLRKEVTMDCVTPSNPHGLHKGYRIQPGEALDIYSILQKTNGKL